jgi:hypothetical protein
VYITHHLAASVACSRINQACILMDGSIGGKFFLPQEEEAPEVFDRVQYPYAVL